MLNGRRAFFLVAALVAAMVLAGCRYRPVQDIAFTATVESVMDGVVTVTTTDDVGFSRASVALVQGYVPGFELAAGQTVKLTIRPDIGESDPVKVTAIKAELVSDAAQPSYAKIAPEQALAIMQQDKAIVLDVRTESEFAEGHIEGAVLLPDSEVAQRAAEVLPDKDATILVYCRSGRRSEAAARALVAMGYTNVLDFGGIIDWPYDTVQ